MRSWWCGCSASFSTPPVSAIPTGRMIPIVLHRRRVILDESRSIDCGDSPDRKGQQDRERTMREGSFSSPDSAGNEPWRATLKPDSQASDVLISLREMPDSAPSEHKASAGAGVPSQPNAQASDAALKPDAQASGPVPGDEAAADYPARCCWTPVSSLDGGASSLQGGSSARCRTSPRSPRAAR